jgi:tetratricopeptide (TPR) repeat protein
MTVLWRHWLPFALLTSIAVSVTANEKSAERMGGHPLAGRHGGLAELLEQADWPAGKPTSSVRTAPNRSTEAAVQEPEAATPPVEMQRPMMRQVEPDRDVTTAFRNLLQERHRLVDQCRLVETLREIQEKEPILQQERRDLEASRSIVDHHRQNVALLQRQVNAAQMPQIRAALSGQLNAATQSLRNAERNQREAVSRAEAADRNVRPLYERLGPNLEPWVRCYRELREYFPRNRLHAARTQVLPILEADIAARNDFHEGRVLAAMGAAYEGDIKAAENHLSRAGDELDRHGLSYTIIGEDLCRSSVDAGMPGPVGVDVANFVTKQLGSLAITQQTPVRCWLIATCLLRQGKVADAKTFYVRGLAKLKKADRPDFDNPLVGDGALLHLVYRSKTLGDPDAAIKKARDFLALAPAASECFEIIRARAALAAADGDWKSALHLMDECGKRCPPALGDDIKSQRSAYVEKRVWIVETKKKAVADSTFFQPSRPDPFSRFARPELVVLP